MHAETARNLFEEAAIKSKERDHQVKEVKSLRRYILHNKRWENDAFADVLITIDRTGAERYEILNSTAKGMQGQILQRILDGEVEASKGTQTMIIPENYETTASTGTKVIDGRTCEVHPLVPKRKSKYLLEGWACVDTHDKAIVHVEGRTSKSVSFWVGKAYLIQDFRNVGPYWYSATSESTADVKLFGPTKLTIQYLDYLVSPVSGPVLTSCKASACSPHLKRGAQQLSLLRD